jgi:hypothetical protein
MNARARNAVLGLVAVVVLLVAGGVVPGVLRHPPEDDGREIAAGVRLWRREGAVVVVVAGNADVGRLAEAVRTRRIRRVDVLVLRSGGSGSARLSAALRRRCAVRLALAPTGHSVPGAQAPAVGQRVAVGALEVAVERDRPRLDVRVGSPGHAPRPRAP